MMRVAVPPVRWSVLAGGALLGTLGLVVAGWAPLERADTAVSEACRAYGEQRPDLIAALRIATNVMETVSFVGLGLAVTLLFAARRDWRAAGFVAAVTAIIPTLWAIPHEFLRRPRPVDGFVTVTSYGFPSGHSANAAAAALVGVLLAWPRLGRSGRVGAVVAAAVFTAFVGASRVALLAHWPSDVVGGWLLALAVVPLVARAVGYRPGAPEENRMAVLTPGAGHAVRAPSRTPARAVDVRPCGGSGRRCRPDPR
jgi:membrane-associated phospholipid phosphatase